MRRNKSKSLTTSRRSKRLTWGDLAHFVLNILLPVAILLLIRVGLVEFAIGLVLISKWRIFAVQPAHWFANIRANGTDLIVGLSSVAFIYQLGQLSADPMTTLIAQSVWAFLYGVWLVGIKPLSSEIGVAAQALVATILGLTALFWFSSEIPETVLVFGAWIIGVTTSRHFLSSYEEPFIRVISFIYGLFMAEFAWIMNRWLTVYHIGSFVQIPQITLVLTTIAYTLGTLYHFHKKDKLTKASARGLILFGLAILVLVIALTDWSGEV